MIENKPLVSIYVLAYNCSKTVVETLDSIYALTYPNIELVVSDDCSRDETVNTCQNWIDSHKDRFQRAIVLTVEHNTGVSKNLRRAIDACQSEWIKGIAGDDALYPDCIEKFMDFVALHPDAKMIHGKCGRFDTYLDDKHLIEIHGSKDQPINRVSTAKQQFDILLCWPCIDAPTVFYHKSVFYIPEIQNCGYPGLEDHPMFLRYTYLGNYIYFCDELICKYRKSDTSLQITTNFNNLITKCYLQHFFDETHKYYHGMDKVAHYCVNIRNLIMYKCKNTLVRSCLNVLMYPLYWLMFKLQTHYDYKRINEALVRR
ncbi:glycosyltransferase family 2 protein [Bacteroides sp.]